MNRDSLNAHIQAKTNDLSALPTASISRLLNLLAEGSITLEKASAEDMAFEEYLKKIGLHLTLFKRGTPDTRVYGTTEPDTKIISTVSIFDGSYVVFIDKNPLSVFEDSQSAHFMADSLQKTLNADISSIIKCEESDLIGIGVDIDFWNYDDITKWFKLR